MSKIRAIISNAQPILFIIMLILCTVFLLQNTSTIQVKFLVIETQIPTIVLILLASLFGFFGGYLFAIKFRWQQKTSTE